MVSPARRNHHLDIFVESLTTVKRVDGFADLAEPPPGNFYCHLFHFQREWIVSPTRRNHHLEIFAESLTTAKWMGSPVWRNHHLECSVKNLIHLQRGWKVLACLAEPSSGILAKI